MTDRPYADVERDALLDLAARTISDPSAHPEHVTSATRVLLSDGRASEALRARIADLPPPLLHRLRELVREVSAALSSPV